jgi:hypothetical protein
MCWGVAVPTDQHLLFMPLTKTVAATNTVRAPPALLTNTDVPLVFV